MEPRVAGHPAAAGRFERIETAGAHGFQCADFWTPADAWSGWHTDASAGDSFVVSTDADRSS